MKSPQTPPRPVGTVPKKKQIPIMFTLSRMAFVSALAIFAVSSLSRIETPIAPDDLHWLVAAKTLYSDGIPQKYAQPDQILASDPHLFLWSVALSFKIFGESEVAARIPGVISGAASIILVFLITRSFSQGNRVRQTQSAALAGLLYASTPAVIQGSLIILIDNTLLVPSLLFLFWAFAQYRQTERIEWGILIAPAMALALWARVTTPPIVAVLLLLYTVTGKNSLRCRLISSGSILSGFLLFAGSWYWYCDAMHIPFWGPIIYPLEQFQFRTQSAGGLTLSQVSQNVISLVLWTGTFLSILFFLTFVSRCREYIKSPVISPCDIFLLAGVMIILLYTLIGGAGFGFPKYHSPAIPLLCISAGIFLSRSQSNHANVSVQITCILILSGFIIQFLAGDLIYVWRYTLRHHLATMLPIVPIFKSAAWKIGFSFIAFILLFILLRSSLKRVELFFIILFSVGTNMGTIFLQNTANYTTGYNYGGQGTIQAARFIREKIPRESVVLAPSEIIYYLNHPNSPYLSDSLWTKIEKLQELLMNPGTSALVYSVTTNTIKQVQTISTNKKIQTSLNQHFEMQKIGTYVIWTRKNVS